MFEIIIWGSYITDFDIKKTQMRGNNSEMIYKKRRSSCQNTVLFFKFIEPMDKKWRLQKQYILLTFQYLNY